MRKDLIFRYLKTTSNRLNLVEKHLVGVVAPSQETVELKDNRIAKEWHSALSSSDTELITTLLKGISNQIHQIEDVIKVLEKQD